MDSETPPTSEAGTSVYEDGDGQIFEDDEMPEHEHEHTYGHTLPPMRSTHVNGGSSGKYGRVDLAFDTEDPASVKMTPRSIQALGVLQKEIGAANGAQVRILLLPRGGVAARSARPRGKLSREPSQDENYGQSKINSGGGPLERQRTTPLRYTTTTTTAMSSNAACDDGYVSELQTSI